MFRRGVLLTVATGLVLAGGAAWGGEGGSLLKGKKIDKEWTGPKAEQYLRRFDLNSMATIEGTITKIERFTPARGLSEGVLLIMTLTDEEEVTVHLGPEWYLEANRIKLEKKENLVVTGSRVMIDGKPIIIATEFIQRGFTHRLRTDTGQPLWHSIRRAPAGG